MKLEAQFKKSVSTISQVVIKTKTDMGIDNLTEYCTYYNSTDQRYKNLAECYKNLYNNYLMLNEKQNNYTGTLHGITRKDTIKTYNGKQDFAFDNGNSSTLTTPIHFPTVMPDGSYLNFHINEYQMNIGVDINGGNVIVENGTYYGACTAFQVTKGSLTINGGFFDLAPTCKAQAPNLANYVVNCYDPSYKNGTATLTITGGTFVNFDPSANPEGAGTSYVAEGYTVEAEKQANGDIWYTVVPA